MAQYIANDPNVKVNANTIAATVNALEIGKEYRISVIERHGIDIAQADAEGWINIQKWLTAFKEIAETVGEKTIFQIGKAVPEHAAFPPEVNNLEIALNTIDMAYHMNHTQGDIGHYRLVSFDANARKAVMVCDNPYPSEFDRGIITTIVRRFKPADSLRQEVVLDDSQPTRKNGADSCTYNITW